MGRRPNYCTALLACRLLFLTVVPLLVQLGVIDIEYFTPMAALSALAMIVDFVSFRILGHVGPLLVCLTLYLTQCGLLLHLRGKALHAHQAAERKHQSGKLWVQKAMISAQATYAEKLKAHFVRPDMGKMPKGHPLNWLHSDVHGSDHGSARGGESAAAPPPTEFGGILHNNQARSISVVLPCAEERENALMTVQRFCERTPEASLSEIIVVDDGSEPPLRTRFEQDKRKLLENPHCKVRILRHETTQGLMNAKLTGGQAATGDVIGFFDCHVAPQKGWEAEIIEKIAQNPRRMVVPAITDLDMDTFDEKVNSAVNAKCYLTFDADFKWFDDESDYIPTISGGLVAMGREWFNLTGGFDNEMHGWGGENLDQSLRAWLCGGEIMRAKSSRIAHMWRSGDHRTASHYVVKARHTNNRGRVVAAWYDMFIPFFRGSVVPQAEVSNYDIVKKQLACKPFSYFLYRFRKMYIGGGVIPTRIFNLREKKTGLCLASNGYATISETCNPKADNQQFQLGNVDRQRDGGTCCSGIRKADSNDCLDYFDDQGSHFYSCDVSGNNQNQQYHLRGDGRIVKTFDHPHTCLFFDAEPRTPLRKRPCEDMPAGEGVWEEYHGFEPVVMQTYRAEVTHHRYAEKFPNLPDN